MESNARLTSEQLVRKFWLETKMSTTLYIGLTSEKYNFDYFQVDVIVPATSSTQHDKTDCHKYVICQDLVEKLMVCVKTEDFCLNAFLNRIRF